MAVGCPALRTQGLFLAVTTLAFAVAASSYIFPHRGFTRGQSVVFLKRGSWWFVDLSRPRTYYYLCLVIVIAALAVLAGFMRTGVWRTIVAVRENEFSPRFWFAAFSWMPVTRLGLTLPLTKSC